MGEKDISPERAKQTVAAKLDIHVWLTSPPRTTPCLALSGLQTKSFRVPGALPWAGLFQAVGLPEIREKMWVKIRQGRRTPTTQSDFEALCESEDKDEGEAASGFYAAATTGS
jgi:hypothetical protein